MITTHTCFITQGVPVPAYGSRRLVRAREGVVVVAFSSSKISTVFSEAW